MWADAIRSEGYRLLRNRMVLFWSLLFVPVAGLILSTISTVALYSLSGKPVDEKMPPEVVAALSVGTVQIWKALVSSTGDLANPVVLLFLLITAATLYAGDYRWETWRLISARNSRDNLVLGKLTVFGGFTVVAMLFLLVGLAGENLIKAAIWQAPLGFAAEGSDAGKFLGFFGLSWLRILQFTMIGLVAAVTTRSLLAALFVPLVVGFAQFFSTNMLGMMGFLPDSWPSVLINPGAGFDALKALVTGGTAAATLPDGLIVKATISVVLWTLLPLIGALAWFRRQDLSKE